MVFDTNEDHLDPERLKSAEKILKFEIVPSALSEKYLQIVNEYFDANEEHDKPDTFYYTYYVKRSAESVLGAKLELNKILTEINAGGVLKIPADLQVETDTFKSENSKLNTLHYIFETANGDPAHQNNLELKNQLWRLNNTIHTVENEGGGVPENITPSWVMTSYLRSQGRALIEPEDYKSFEIPQPFKIYLDYGIAGKDLLDCFQTGDIELIRRKAFRQQRQISSCLFLDMCCGFTGSGGYKKYLKSVDTEKTKKQYNQWLVDQKIGDYVDLNDPVNTVGRPCLAVLNDNSLDDQTWFQYWDLNYSLAGIFFS